MVLAGFTVPGVGWSDSSVPTGYQSVAAERGIPASVLYAVALTESGKQVDQPDGYRPWPWTLNVAGRGYYFTSRLDAWRALTGWLEAGKRSIDIGLMQVNWRYHQDRLGTPWQALEPYHNLRVGAGILHDCYTTKRTTGGPVSGVTTHPRMLSGPIATGVVWCRGGNGSSALGRVMQGLHRLGLWCVALAFVFVPIHARAELTVIYDSGDTQPLAPYLEVFEPADRVPRQSPAMTPPPLGAADPEAWLPIQSIGLTPGVVQSRAIHRPFSQPLFLIGADAHVAAVAADTSRST